MADTEVRSPQSSSEKDSTGDLFRRLSDDASKLVRQEVALAKAELSEKGKQAGVGAGMFGGAGVAGLLALGALTACLILALDEVMVDWLAALVITVIWAAIAAVLGLRGKQKVDEAGPPQPEETIETLKEDVQWAKSQARSDTR
jgi:uncharacterized membrane protein YqjE